VRLVTIRAGLVADLDSMDAAGAALRWARHLLPPRHPEPAAWTVLLRLLDALDDGTCPAPPERGPQQKHGQPPRGALALAGLRLLASVGYALELERCIVCGRPCPAAAPSYIDPVRGGIVCRDCGGGGRILEGRTRGLAARAQRAPDDGEDWLLPLAALTATETETLLSILGDAMAAHAGLERT